MPNIVWLLVWIIIPFIIGFAIWGILGGLGFAVLGFILYITQRVMTVNYQQEKQGLKSKDNKKLDIFSDWSKKN